MDDAGASQTLNISMWVKERMTKQERQIQDWRFHVKYQTVIDDLKEKINVAIQDNSALLLTIDTLKLARDDYHIKFNNELAVRTFVEVDVAGLRRTQGALMVTCCDLEMQEENLKGELFYLTRNIQEVKMEMESIRSHISSSYMNTKMDAKSQENLNSVLDELEAQYEGIIEKDHCDLEALSKEKHDELNKQMKDGKETVRSSQNELDMLRRTIQTLEIELQSQLSLKSVKTGTLGEIEWSYRQKLQQLQALVDNLEREISKETADIQQQDRDFQNLLDIKTKMEMEIKEYKRNSNTDEKVERSNVITT